MTDCTAACDWGRAWPSRSRTQGAAFAGCKGKPEDAEMRSATCVIQACGVVGSVISLDERGQRVGPRDHSEEATLVVDYGKVIVMLVGDPAGNRLGTGVVVDDDRIGAHQLRDLGRERLVEPLLKALHRTDEDDPAHDVEVVGKM